MTSTAGSREIEPERLGRIGEDHFRLLCSRADLIPDKSDIDMTGWDFVVEKVPERGASQPLDQHRVQAAHVQLKTTRGRGNNRVRLKLSAAQRLALDPRPALVIVLRAKPDGSLMDGYIVHLLGAPLERLLYRLRLAQARGEEDINRKGLSFDYVADGTRFEATPEGLLAAIEACWGVDATTYIAHKEWELDNLGYDEHRFGAEALVRLEGPEHLNDMLLGLRPMRPERVRSFEKRFGIAVPYLGGLFDDVEEYHLIPPSLGACDVRIRAPGLQPAANFVAEMFIGPPIEELGGPELLIRHDDFIIRFRPNELKFESVGSLDSDRRTLAGWRMFVRALTYLASPDATIIISGSARMPAIPIAMPGPIDGPYLEDLPRLAKFLDNWTRLIEMAGVQSDAKMTFDSLWEAKDAWLAADLAFNTETSAFMETQLIGEDELDTFEGLYFNSAILGDAGVNYAIQASFERTQDPVWVYRTTGFKALDVSPIAAELDEYGAEQMRLHNLNVLLDPASMTRTDPSTIAQFKAIARD